MTNFEIVLIYDLLGDLGAQNNIFFFESDLKPDQPLHKKISLSDISELHRRRFLGQNKALELFLMSGKNVLLNFPDVESRDQLAKKILRQRNNKCKNLKYFTSLDHKWIMKKKLLTEDWMSWRISNFEYLMQLNQLASRSYNDLSQYPVVPWVLACLST